jgi:hypothetical protein
VILRALSCRQIVDVARPSAKNAAGIGLPMRGGVELTRIKEQRGRSA